MEKNIFNDCVTTTDTIWTAKQLCEYAKQGMASFDNAVQRNLVWTQKQKSLLIHSLMVNFLPPEFLANKKDGKYDMIDGKQRHNAISSYLDNQYPLTDIPLLVDAAGIEYNFNGKTFNNLPEEIQDKITGRGLKISVMDNAGQDIIKEYFYRRNNGTSLTNIRKTLVVAKSFDAINDLSKHKLFETILSPKALGGDEARNVVMKSYGILYFDSKSLENKKVFPAMKRMMFTDEQIDIITTAYDIILEAYTYIQNNMNDDSNKNKLKILNRIKTKTHVITLMPIIAEIVIPQEVSIDQFAEWLYKFFNGTDGATPYEEYNKNSVRGSSQVSAVETRLSVAKQSLVEFLGV